MPNKTETEQLVRFNFTSGRTRLNEALPSLKRAAHRALRHGWNQVAVDSDQNQYIATGYIPKGKKTRIAVAIVRKVAREEGIQVKVTYPETIGLSVTPSRPVRKSVQSELDLVS